MIPLVDLLAPYLEDKKAIDQAIEKVLLSGRYLFGSEVELFEKEFANYLKTECAVGVACGTDALILALKALDLEKDDEVIIPANSYPTAFAAASVASIKLVDIDLQTLNINPKEIEKAITAKTKVILPIYLFGLMSPMEEISRIARKYKLKIVADASQAHGASLNGKMAGAIGDFGCFSFYPTKNLGAYGDAGAVVTHDQKLAQKVKELRMYGEKERFKSQTLSTQSRMDEIQAAILRIKLKKLDNYNQKRINAARKYFELLKDLPLGLPPKKTDGSHVYHVFAIQTPYKTKLRNFLKKEGVQTGSHSGLPTHLLKPFAYLGYKRGDFPNAEKSIGETLFLPCYPQLEEKTVEKICSLVKKFFKR